MKTLKIFATLFTLVLLFNIQETNAQTRPSGAQINAITTAVPFIFNADGEVIEGKPLVIGDETYKVTKIKTNSVRGLVQVSNITLEKEVDTSSMGIIFTSRDGKNFSNPQVDFVLQAKLQETKPRSGWAGSSITITARPRS